MGKNKLTHSTKNSLNTYCTLSCNETVDVKNMVGKFSTEAGKTFVAEYKKAYPDRENIAAVTALGYDGYMMTLDAIERAGSADPVAIRDALAATKDFEGATGMITIDANGDATKNEAIIKTVKDGKFTYLDSVTID